MEVSVSTLAEQVSFVLTSTAANTLTMEDLKTLLTKYLQKTNTTDDCSPSVSISAMETEGDTRPPIVQVAKHSPLHVPGLSSKSAFGGGLTPEPAQQAPRKETSIIATTMKASAIPEQGGMVKALGRPPVNSVAMMAVQEPVPLPDAKSALQRKPETL